MKKDIEKIIANYKNDLEDYKKLFEFYMETYNEKMSDYYNTKITMIEKFIKDLEVLLK